MAIIELDPKHCIGERLYDGPFNLNSFFFGHKPLISYKTLLSADIHTCDIQADRKQRILPYLFFFALYFFIKTKIAIQKVRSE